MTPRRPTFLDGVLRRALGPLADVVLGDLEEEWPERAREVGSTRARWWYVRTVVATVASAMTAKGTVAGRGGRGAGAWLRDARHEARALLRAPGWTILAVATIVVGTTFAAVVFALGEAMRTELVPYRDGDSLFHLVESNGQAGAVADPTLRRLEARDDVFADVVGWTPPREANLVRADASPAVARVSAVTPGAFATLGYAPVAGRLLRPGDADPGGPAVALLSHGFWAREAGGSADALGATVELNGRPFRVVGIMPPETRLPPVPGAAGAADLWIPVERDPGLEADPRLQYQVLVRPAPGVDAGALAAAADQVLSDLRAALPGWRDDPSWHMDLRPLRARLEGDGAGALGALAVAGALLLTLAAANLVALTLARLQSREREFTVHAALGAPPSLPLRRLLLQNALLALAGGTGAALLARWALGTIRAAAPAWLPGAAWVSPDPLLPAGTVAAALALVLGVAGVAGLLRPGAGRGLATLRAGGAGPRWRALARGLVLVETGMVVSLSVGAGLVVRSLAELASVDAAVALEDRFAARVDLVGPGYGEPDAIRDFARRVLDRARGIPGVDAVAMSTSAPFARTFWNFVALEGADPADGRLPQAQLEEVTAGYFEATGLSLVAGRRLEARDYGVGREPVAVVNETLAALFDGSAVGRTLAFDDLPPVRVVGVARDSPAGRLDRPAGPRVYLTAMEHALPWTVGTRWFLVRSAPGASLGEAAAALRAAAAEADPDIPLHPPRPLAELRGDMLADARFRGLVFGLLAALALVLGGAGIYGVVSHALGAARRETGIRLALGASRVRVFTGTVAAEARAVFAGVALGTVAAWQLGSLLGSVLFGVSPADPPTYLAAVLGTGTLAGLAIVLPAYRAAAADPVASLGAE